MSVAPPCDHAFDFAKYASRYWAALAYRFNRHFQLKGLSMQILASAITSKPRAEAWLRSADESC